MSTLRNALRIPELRKKILYTLFILVIFRLGAAIPVPFINIGALSQMFQLYSGTLLGYFNILSGGALSEATLFALTITPYINASIIIQLLTVAIPSLERMVKEGGEEGQKKMERITRYATVALGLILGFTYYTMIRSYGLLTRTDVWSAIVIILSFTAGSALVMWLGEKITEKGIGNGISLILLAGIVSRGRALIFGAINSISSGTIGYFTLVFVVLISLVMMVFVVFMQNAERRIPIQYAKRVVGRKQYGGQSTHLPIRVSMSGVMPIIFASSLVSLPGTIALFLRPTEGTFWYGFTKAFESTHPVYIVLYMILIIAFAYFYSAIQFNPIEVSNNLKKNGGFIPGFRAGKPTSDFITRVLNKITLIGALFLGVIALVPLLMGVFMKNASGLALGGTSLLIIVGVVLETVKEIEAQMLMRHYKGFLE